MENQTNVKYPHYRKDAAHFFKVYSPEKCLVVVYTTELDTLISVANSNLAFVNEGIEISGKEFEKAYLVALNQLSEIIAK